MGEVIVINNVTLDGVMQAPGRPDEDTRDGFEHGGWAAAYSDRATVAKMGATANLVILGSGVLIGSLMAADVIDEYVLMIAPLVLGTGRRLFAGGTQTSLRLVETVATSTGVVMTSYERTRD